MGRGKIKTDYNAERIQQEMMEIAVKLYKAEHDIDGKKHSLRFVAEELGISVSKAVKLLITAGEYTTNLSERIREMYENGKSVSVIQRELGVSRATVHSYLPYQKGIYSARETSQNADRIRKYRERCKAVEGLGRDCNVESLWKCIALFEGYTFRTAKGLKYKYSVKCGEIFVDRKEKSLTRATVALAFENARKLMNTVGYVSSPKRLGTFGASYLYPVFLRFGIIKEM